MNAASRWCAVAALAAATACGGGGSGTRPPPGFSSPPGAVLTNWPVVTFQPRGIEGAKAIELWRDGTLEATMATAYPSPSFTWDGTGFADGTYVFKLRVRFDDAWIESAPVPVTIDRVVPRLVDSSPAVGASVEGPVTEIRLTFSEPLRPDRVNAGGFVVRAERSGSIPHTAVLLADQRTVVVYPSRVVAAPDQLSVQIAGGAVDLAGNEVPMSRSEEDTFTYAVTSPWQLVGNGMLNGSWGGGWNATLFQGPGGALYANPADYEVSVLRLDGSTWAPAAAGWPTGYYSPTYASDGLRIWTTALGYGQVASVHRWTGTEWEQVGPRILANPSATVDVAPLLAFDAWGPIAAWNEYVGPLAPGVVTTAHLARWNGTAWAELSVPTELATSPVMAIRGNVHGAWALLFDSSSQGRRTILARIREGAVQFVAFLPKWRWSPALALDDAGAVYVAEIEGNQLEVFRLSGSAWEPLGVAATWGDHVYTEYALAVGPRGPAVAWTDAWSPDAPRALRVAALRGTLWVERGGVLNTSMEHEARTPFLAFDASGSAHVIWTENLGGTQGSIVDPLRVGVFVKAIAP